MKKHFIKAALLLAAAVFIIPAAPVSAAPSVTVKVSPGNALSEISPYIFGVNDFAYSSAVTVNSIRQGGNRYTAYNWENNFSNAGSDWHNSSDTYLLNGVPSSLKKLPAAPMLNLHQTARNAGADFTLVTLQMAGYVSADSSGNVTEAAPSSRWAEVVSAKGSAFSLSPDAADGKVYMDELVNYLTNRLETAKNGGITAYALDNEPALWSGTHSLVETSPVTCAELIEKSAALSAAVKSVDSSALVFGPALYGYNAYCTLQGASDWNSVKGSCRWFIDYYLKNMKAKSDAAGTRLLDVLDVHYYTEAKCSCGARMCTHTTAACIQTRLDSTRTLWDSSYKENSWIAVDTGGKFLPLLPNLNSSIDKYYPGTRLAFTEYDFGGANHISDAVVEADVLGIFAENGVYFSTLWPTQNSRFQLAAINMYTNYDGKGGAFEGELVSSESSDRSLVSSYSAVDSNGTLRVILINKSISADTSASVSISGSTSYSVSGAYTLSGSSTDIKAGTASISANKLNVTLPALSVTEIVLTDGGAAVVTTTVPATEKPAEKTTVAVVTTSPVTSSATSAATTEPTEETTSPEATSAETEPEQTTLPETEQTHADASPEAAPEETAGTSAPEESSADETTSPAEAEAEGAFPFLPIIIGGAVVLAAVAFVVIKFVIKKK